ncbi:MAG: dienelactone hydrolase family protein [Planctomycetes bacterium]|nr:dienelactone hydrolase family protein [Planctomycetota bacterium]
MNRPGELIAVTPYDTQAADGHVIESVFLDFDDRFGRRCRVYASRCLPLNVSDGAKVPAVLHLPGGGQTVFRRDLTWWAMQGFAAYGYDWQIGAAMVHGEGRCSRWPEGVVNQGAAHDREEQAVLPLAIRAAGVVIDWMSTDPRVDVGRVGVTGISWGGYLTWAVNAHEPRLRAAAPVYGCGGLFRPEHAYKVQGGSTLAEAWRGEWDAEALGARQQSPVCYISSTNDFFGYHMTADALVSGLTVAHRRSSDPNNDHHVAPGSSALGVAWFRHYLDGGPPVPREPVLRGDLMVDADASEPITATEVWWTPSDTPDDQRCWLKSPIDRGAARQAFGRVHYASGIALNTPTVVVNARPVITQIKSDTWPDATDGTASWWGMRSTQYYRTDITVTPVAGDATRAVWEVDRQGGGPLAVLFRGLADPRWNDGKFDALEIEIDPCGKSLDGAQAVGNFVIGVDRRLEDVVSLTPVSVEGRLRFTIRPTDFPKRPDGAGWAELRQVTITGTLGGNRFVFGPVRKVGAAQTNAKTER